MVYVLSAVIFVLAAAIILLILKVIVLRISLTQICEELLLHLKSDSNVLISVYSGDKAVRRLASTLNRELKTLRKLKLKYEQGDEELKTAITNISHDLRTPLTAISGYLDILDTEPLTESARKYIGIIKGRADDLKTLTEEFFKYSVIMDGADEDEKETVDIKSVLAETLIGFYGVFTEAGIEPDIIFPEAAVYRFLSKSGIVRILNNVISNAVKYGKGDLKVGLTDGGRITVSNRSDELDEVTVGRLFDRFYTVESSRYSTGLGLSIARTLAEKNGGEIYAHYAGGIFSIVLDFR